VPIKVECCRLPGGPEGDSGCRLLAVDLGDHAHHSLDVLGPEGVFIYIVLLTPKVPP
jgi:hypothetical protein